MLCLLSATEERKKNGRGRREDAKRRRSPVVGGPADHVYELKNDAHQGWYHKPLPVKGHEKKIKCDLLAEVITHPVGMLFRHDHPVVNSRRKVLQGVVFVQWEKALQLVLVEEVSHTEAC